MENFNINQSGFLIPVFSCMQGFWMLAVSHTNTDLKIIFLPKQLKSFQITFLPPLSTSAFYLDCVSSLIWPVTSALLNWVINWNSSQKALLLACCFSHTNSSAQVHLQLVISIKLKVTFPWWLKCCFNIPSFPTTLLLYVIHH